MLVLLQLLLVSHYGNGFGKQNLNRSNMIILGEIFAFGKVSLKPAQSATLDRPE